MTTNMNRMMMRGVGIVLMLLMATTAWAEDYSGSCGTNVKWVLTDEDGDNIKETLTIRGSGAMTDYNSFSGSPWYSYRDNIKTVVIKNGVKSIGNSSFYDCSDLTSVTIPESVASIGAAAFANCSALESIIVVEGNNTYDSRNNCNAIIEKSNNKLIVGCKKTVIPDDVTIIGSYAFNGCSGLTSVTIPSSVTSIGNYVFSSCYELTSVTIPSSVTIIGEGAFYDCRKLPSVTIPSSVTIIGSDAFWKCTSLTDVYCLGVPETWGGSIFDFIQDPAKSTVCHVAGSKLETFESKFSEANVTFWGDGIEGNSKAYVAGMTMYKSGTPPEDVKAFLPVGYDLSTATVELAEVKGAPKNLPVIYGPAKDGEKLPDVFFLKYVADDSDAAKDIQSDYDNALKGMDKRFVITDGTKTLADVISGTGVDAGEAVILVLANGKFTSVDFSAADLDKKAKAGLLLFVLTKWEYMHISSGTSNATARTIGIGNGQAMDIETTNFTNYTNFKNEAGAQYYDLQGRKISGKPTKKGIYIFKGEKVAIK